MRAIQFLIMAAVVCGCIWFQQTYDYEINPFIIGAWAFMAAYGATLAYVRLADWRIRRGGNFAGTAGEDQPD